MKHTPLSVHSRVWIIFYSHLNDCHPSLKRRISVFLVAGCSQYTGSSTGSKNRCHVFLPQVLLTYVCCREYRNKRRGRGRLLHIRTPLRLFALNQAHHTNDLKSKFTSRLDRL